ncbi:GLEYA domain-containing protein [Jackrogersella minutella]|nr:GLEYA domain-containing protein [Jackrogersella minutella]
MHTTSTFFKLLCLAPGALVFASPVASPATVPSKAQCSAVNVIVNVLNIYKLATPFCSSYLHIPTVTKTVATAECSINPGRKRRALAAVDPRAAAATTSLPAVLASFASSQLSTACGCLTIATPTTTVTSFSTTHPVTTTTVSVVGTTTTTPTTLSTTTSFAAASACAAAQQCGNQGVQWAEYPNTSGDNEDGTYSSFLPEAYKTATPDHTGTLSNLGGIANSDLSAYGSSIPSTEFVLNHRGYLFVPQTGTYTFSHGRVDDGLVLWVGSPAYQGWTRANADFAAAYGTGAGSATVDLVAGDYVPIRYVFAQADGGSGFQLTVTAPDGTVFLDSTTTTSPYLVQYLCGDNARMYPDFGQET